MMLELVATVTSLYGLPIRLFRNPQTQEGVLIGREVAALMGYGSLRHLLIAAHGLESVHFFILQGEELKRFRTSLVQQHLPASSQCRRLLMITETGISFLMGKHCKEKAVRAGDWLLSNLLPRLRPFATGIYCQQIESAYLNCSLHLLLANGRFGVVLSQVLALLTAPPLDHITRSLHGYIPHLHCDLLLSTLKNKPVGGQPANDTDDTADRLFYESGLYRYWNSSPHPLVPLMKIAFEREIWPACRLANAWAELRPTVVDEEPVGADELAHAPSQAREPPAVYAEVIDSAHPGDRPPASDTDTDDIYWEEILHRLERIEMQQMENASMIHEILGQHLEELKKLAAGNESLVKTLEEEQQLLLARLTLLSEILRTYIMADEPNLQTAPPGFPVFALSVPDMRDLATSLGLYYLDKTTPHVVFTQHLVTHTGSIDPSFLTSFLVSKFAVHSGENQAVFMGNEYRFWKR